MSTHKDLEKLLTICFRADMSFFSLDIIMFFRLRVSCNSAILYMQKERK